MGPEKLQWITHATVGIPAFRYTLSHREIDNLNTKK